MVARSLRRCPSLCRPPPPPPRLLWGEAEVGRPLSLLLPLPLLLETAAAAASAAFFLIVLKKDAGEGGVGSGGGSAEPAPLLLMPLLELESGRSSVGRSSSVLEGLDDDGAISGVEKRKKTRTMRPFPGLFRAFLLAPPARLRDFQCS